MENFSILELKNIAREEQLCGWSKFKKEDLFNFLVENSIDLSKYEKPKKSKINVVTQALEEDISIVDQNLAIKTELCKSISKKLKNKKKADIVQEALELNININKPNGKPKTIKELLEDISLQLLKDQQLVPEEASYVNEEPVENISLKCLKKCKKEVVAEALTFGVVIAHPNGKLKTIKELCLEIELAKISKTDYSTTTRSYDTDDVLIGAVGGETGGATTLSSTTESATQCVITPEGAISCDNEQQEEICVVTNMCSTNDVTGEEICAPVNVCAPSTSTAAEIGEAYAAPILIPIFNTRSEVDMQDIQSALTEISDPTVSYNKNLIVVKETVFKALGLI